MSVQTVERAVTMESTIRTVSTMSFLGSLADDVVLELLKVKAGQSVKPDGAIQRTSKLLATTLESDGRTGGLLHRVSFGDALRQVAASRVTTWANGSLSNDGAATEGEIRRLVEHLDAVLVDSASNSVVESLLATFEGIGRITLAVAANCTEEARLTSWRPL